MDEKTKVKFGRSSRSVSRAIVFGSLFEAVPFSRDSNGRLGVALTDGVEGATDLMANAGFSENCFSSIVTLRASRLDLNKSRVALAGETSMSVASDSASVDLLADEPNRDPPNASWAKTTSLGAASVIQEGVVSIASDSAILRFAAEASDVGVVLAAGAAGEPNESGDGVDGAYELLTDPFPNADPFFCFFEAGVGL